MPRRKQLKISVKDLKVYETLVTELQKNPIFSDCDLSTLEIIALSKKTPPRIIKENLDKAIRNIERQIALMAPIKYLIRKVLVKQWVSHALRWINGAKMDLLQLNQQTNFGVVLSLLNWD